MQNENHFSVRKTAAALPTFDIRQNIKGKPKTKNQKPEPDGRAQS